MLTPAAQTGFKGSTAPPITSTGMKGFLQWYQREQPAVYAQAAPVIQQQLPQVFSGYNQSKRQVVRSRAGLASLERRVSAGGRLPRAMTRLHGLGQCLCFESCIAAGLQSPNVCLATEEVSCQALCSITVAAPSTTTCVASTANTSAGTSTPTTSAVASIIGGIVGATLVGSQLETANAMTDQQLLRAQAGLVPLNLSMGASGVPLISSTGTSGTGSLLLVLLIGAGLLLMMGEDKGRREESVF
jgi:hypothetical protein